jgi:putative hemolysin
MKHWSLLVMLALFAVIGALIAVSFAPAADLQTASQPVRQAAAAATTAPAAKPVIGMPNPASVFCEKNGGKLDIRKDATGGEAGMCVFPDKSECDEWAFFRGDCKPGGKAVIGMANPASVFCEKNGGKLDIRKDATGGEIGMCVFPDKSECEEWAFYRDQCKPGSSSEANMPNPASVFCEENGGKLDIRKDAKGGEYGICVFPDKSECEEWAFFRGECKPGGKPTVEPAVIGMVNPASVFCEKSGGKLDIRKDTQGGEYGVCVFAADSECEEWDLMRGACMPGAAFPVPMTPIRIDFLPGANNATVQDDLPADGLDRYVLKAVAGQSLSMNTTAAPDTLDITVYGADGAGVLSERVGNATLSAKLPVSQDYYIDVQSVVTAPVGYVMQVTLPAAPPAPLAPPPAPQLIRFTAGATTISIKGKISDQGSMPYYLAASARQVLTAKIAASDAPAFLTIHGADGTVLISDHAGARSWSGALPKSQYYYITIHTEDPKAANFTLQITIPPLATPVPKPTAKRISFAPGATSASVRGTLAAGGLDRYIIAINAGQTLAVDLSLPPGAGMATLVIYGADGTVLISDHAGATQWSGRVPKKQDYYIEVKAPAKSGAGYTMTVTIPPK